MKTDRIIRLIVLLALCIAPYRAAANIFIADSIDHAPLPGSSLVLPDGTILGITDDNGAIDLQCTTLPFTVRCMGYAEKSVDAISDTVFLAPRNFMLPGLVVVPVDRPVLNLKCYIREYTTAAFGNDTIHMFGEYMADYFLVEQKVKGFKTDNKPKVRASRKRIRHKNASGLDSTAIPGQNGIFMSWLAICSIDPAGKTVPDSVMNGHTMSTAGQYGVLSSMRLSDNRLMTTRDALANRKDHHWSPWIFKLLGLTTDVKDLRSNSIHIIDDRNTYSPRNLQMASFTIEMTMKGKWIKKIFHSSEPITCYSIIEIYPTEAIHLTAVDAKETRNDDSAVEIMPSPMAPPLPLNIVEMLEAEIPEADK